MGKDITELNKIDLVKQTRRTETSKYPEEKTSTEIPLVVASERGPGQCLMVN
jgi:ribosome biogenesis GTPase A